MHRRTFLSILTALTAAGTMGPASALAFAVANPVNPRWWGADPTGETDSGPALVAMRDWLHANPHAKGWEIRFDTGTYRTSRNDWLSGIPSITVFGGGSSMENIARSANHAEQYGLFLNSPVYTGGITRRESGDAGILIRTAEPGTGHVVCLRAEQAARAVIGQNAVITSFSIQDKGYPPSHAFFDFVKVTGIDPATGRIQFAERLKRRHRADYPEAPGRAGRARLWLGNPATTSYIADHAAIHDLKIVGREGTLAGRVVLAGARRLTADNLEAEGLTVGETESVTVTNCRIAGTFEPDKHIGTLVIENCQLGALNEATGVDRLLVRGGVIANHGTVGARSVAYEGVEIHNRRSPNFVASAKQGWFTTAFSIRDCTLVSHAGKVAGGFVVPRWSAPIPAARYTVEDDVIAIDRDTPKVLAALSACIPGSCLLFTNGAWAEVLDLWEGRGGYVIRIAPRGDCRAADGFSTGGLIRLTMKDNRYLNCYPFGGSAMVNQVEDIASPDGLEIICDTGIWGKDGVTPWTRPVLSVNRIVTSIQVDVARPYAGPAALLVATVGGRSIDLKRAGASHLSAGDAATASSETYVETLPIRIGQGAEAAVPPGSPGQQATIRVSLRFAPLQPPPPDGV
jgi:hypothetical protein